MTGPPLRIALPTALALLAFAGNSLLCRAALGADLIGPLTFSGVRLAAGAAVLAALVALRRRRGPRRLGGGPAAALMLFGYVIGFSFAYVDMTTGTGALLLFGAVQLTMTAQALRRGERPRPTEWAGMGIALTGLVVLVLPGLQAPPPLAALAMAAAGVAWGVYTLLGRGSVDPLGDTAGNFVRALLPMACAALGLVAGGDGDATVDGILLAATSGALTSGVGYALWYAALPALTRTQAALLQLAAPVLAALLGVALLAEPLTARLAAALVLVPGGIAVAILARRG